MSSASPQSTLPPLRWLDIQSLAIEGRGWADTDQPFDRLPARARHIVNADVWNFSHDTAGMLVHFSSDTPELRIRGTLRKPKLEMAHMPSSGVSGLDLYTRADGGWQWFTSFRPEGSTEISGVIFQDIPAQRREFLLYLPLYNGIRALEIGVSGSASCEAVVRSERPVVFYGTSIVQGACASRPGMAYTSILRRRLDWPMVNLGFSGSGKAEPEVAALVAELEARLFMIDCLPNLQADQVGRVEQFVGILRRRHATTPIVLVESVQYPNGVAVPARKERHERSNQALREIHARLARTDRNLHLIPSADLIGTDGEGTVDGVHPTDLGMRRMADRVEPVLRRLLDRAG